MKHLKPSYSTKILLMSFLIILVMALLLSFFSWQISSTLFSQMEKELLGGSAESAYTQLSAATKAANNFTTQVIRSDALQALLSMGDTTEKEAETHIRQLNRVITEVTQASASSTTSAIQFINVFLKNGYQGGSAAGDTLPYRSFEDCVAALERSGITELDAYVPTCWIDNIKVQSVSINGHCLVGMRFLYDSITLEKVGVVVIGIKQSGLQTIFEGFNTNIYLVQQDGTVISAARTNYLGQVIDQADALIDAYRSNSRSHLTALESGKEAFVYRMAGGASWLICPIDENLLSHSSAANEYYRFVISLTLFALALALLLSWLSSKGLTKSLVRLKGVVQKVHGGDMTARFQTNQHDEIAYLGLRINDMLDQVEEAFHTQERNAAEKQNLELQLMQSQINPHLLYNTLNSALWIIRQKDTEKAEELILSLSSFFKLALSKGNEEITLANEISMIQYYLKLQNLGRGKSFSLRDEVPEAWRSCKILRLTLQPFVENAVIHGFSDWRDDGEIVISAQADEELGQLQITLCDNGIGILPEDLNSLMEDLHTYPPQKEHQHYGLYNVERRIKNKYGPQYGLSMESEVGDFTKITLTLPINKEKQYD